MKNLPLLLATIVGSLVLVFGIAYFFSGGSGPAQNNNPATFAEAEQEPEEIILGDARNTTGPEDATITIVEFSDLQCPACKAIAPLVKQVLAEHPEDVKLVYRHFPLNSIHPYAQLAAYASEAAADEGKCWEFHDKLFEQQPVWSKMSSAGEVEDIFVTYADELGIDTAVFQEKIGSEEIKERVLQDVADTNKLGLTGTPTLFVNNRRVPAPGQLPAIVQSLIEENSQQ
jgi:protein-disulfide isomerase